MINSVEDKAMDVDQKPDPLDLILDRTHGQTIVRNVIGLVLTGKIDTRGRTPKDPSAIEARRIAQSS